MMSNKYIGGSGGAEDSRYLTAENDGQEIQLSAEEIAEVLASAYQGGSVVGRKETEPDDSQDTKAAETGRNIRRQQRLLEMRRRKRQQELMRKFMIPCAVVLVICVILAGMGIRTLVAKLGKPQDMRQSGTVNTDSLDQDDSGSGDLAQSDTTQTDPGLDDTDQIRTDSNKKVSYDNSLNVAGCYIGSMVSDRFNEEFAQMRTLSVQTLGGKNTKPPLTATADEATALPSDKVISQNSIFIDVEAGRILEQRDAGARISPASMTKILTILVAAEHITDPDDTFVITQDITDYSYVNDCSNAGFDVGEKVTVRDLFYGTILPSGADAAMGLAIYTAGSQEAFVALMNEKIDELGLSRTSHFTNCVGLYDENHYSTSYDMAVMLKAACDNSFCREVLSAHIYTTSVTEQHPEGITLSNWFLRRIEDKDTRGEVLCAKTGYVVQSGNCAASLCVDKNGKEYICVTAHSNSSWRCIYDHVELCQQLLPQ